MTFTATAPRADCEMWRTCRSARARVMACDRDICSNDKELPATGIAIRSGRPADSRCSTTRRREKYRNEFGSQAPPTFPTVDRTGGTIKRSLSCTRNNSRYLQSPFQIAATERTPRVHKLLLVILLIFTSSEPSAIPIEMRSRRGIVRCPLAVFFET